MTQLPAHAALPASTSALHGVVVLDFSHVIAGPFATYYLAALGARVIKVENPHLGDSLRGKPQAFESLNHGKEVVQIDLKSEAGLAKAWELFALADVFVDNMRPGVLESFGFGESALRQKKPSLIYCSISGYGRQGAWAKRPTFDHVVQAASGMTLLGGKAEDDPIKVGFPVIDSASGILAALGILGAIRRRDLTGLGESLDVSMMGAAMQLMYPMAVETLATGKAPNRVGNVGYSGSPGAETFRCRDGWLALGANTPKQMRALADVLGIREQVEPLLNGQAKGFVSPENGAKIKALLLQTLTPASASDLEQRLNAANVPAAKVRDMGEALQEAEHHQLMSPWTLHGATTTVRVPGLGFQADTLFGGNKAPFSGLTPSATATSEPSH